MSRSDNRSQKYLDLYQLRQDSIAKVCHSDLAQPIVAAKNFAKVIGDMEGDDANMQEVRELAGVILEMTNHAYTVTYDLMQELETDAAKDSYDSMESTINEYGELLRLSKRGIEMNAHQNLDKISLDRFVHVVVLDWVKAFLIYLARQTDVNFIEIKLVGSDAGLTLDVMPNVALTSEQLATEIAIVNIQNQLQVLDGTFSVDESGDQTCVRIIIPPSEMLAVIK